MKNFSKVQKKGILSSRALQNNRLHNSSQNFDEMVEKQLEDDFKVHQYLNQNASQGHNTEQYLALINTLLVKKLSKQKRKQLLKSSKARFQISDQQQQDNKNLSRIQVKSQPADTYYSEQEYLRIKEESEVQQQIIQAKTEQELEMKRILQKQITEKKKSLHLLKGDISHMITRNESISVLQSKVNKVSLVSQNQLKRVSLALTKDKQQVSLRRQMQKKFYNKLKAVQNHESKNLKKIKLSYIETMNRRKQIFDNLSLIEKQCASIEEYSDKQKQKQEKNSKTIALFNLLKFVSTAIDKSLKNWKYFEQKKVNVEQFSQNLKTFFNSQQILDQKTLYDDKKDEIQLVNQERLNELVIKIVREYHRLNYSIEQNKKNYNQHMASIQQYWLKLQKHHSKVKQMLSQFHIENRNELNSQQFSIQDYSKKLQLFQSNFNILYAFFDFLNKKTYNFEDIHFVSSLYDNQSFHFNMQSRNQKIDNSINLKLFGQINSKLEKWFEQLKKNIEFSTKFSMQAKQQLKKFIYTRINQNIKNRKSSNASYDENSNGQQRQQNEGMINLQEKPEMAQSQLYDYRQNEANAKTYTNIHSLKRSQQDSKEQMAKRVQILQKIDQSYYSMIKQTIQMQKQNTKKNYQFQKSFKRNKYSSQDEILEQKRFQATFSSLFKQDPDDLTKNGKGRSIQLKVSRFLSRSTKLPKNSAFLSLHNSQKQNKSKMKMTYGLDSTRASSNSAFWERQKKIKLSAKLKDILSQV